MLMLALVPAPKPRFVPWQLHPFIPSSEKRAPDHKGGSENAAPGAASLVPKSNKRKSADGAVPSGTTVAPAAKKAKAAKPKPDPLDVSGMELDGEDSHEVPVYDTRDTIRRRIAAAVLKDGRKVQTNSFSNFMSFKGSLAGNCNTFFYASYVFFEKLRIKQGKPTTGDREVMEAGHPDGVDVTRQSGKIGYVVHAGMNVSMDKNGCPFTYWGRCLTGAAVWNGR
ncbi:hypothetical protein QBC33DRAFT_602278 [Phialemonium atrogriseum]|uniref:Uncharacterized protein n=1 Tax=Phialemonium atrogriseum TaxID=1093897 RepID=A0AAJ0BRF1_9PEZI|nr:uncharacterized protein QBC33DRAFT_602278 [Phialemonium atrogriseum]KAK1762033.1 hypothetical protein QBC33DRAFT_602278 [Phialemonium atrogriseum]